MTSLEKFQSLDVNVRESFLSALGMFRELDAAYRTKAEAAAPTPAQGIRAPVRLTESAPVGRSESSNDSVDAKRTARLRERIALDI